MSVLSGKCANAVIKKKKKETSRKVNQLLQFVLCDLSGPIKPASDITFVDRHPGFRNLFFER